MQHTKIEMISKSLLDHYIKVHDLVYYEYSDHNFNYITVGHKGWGLEKCKQQGYIITCPKETNIYASTLRTIEFDKYKCNTRKNS